MVALFQFANDSVVLTVREAVRLTKALTKFLSEAGIGEDAIEEEDLTI